MLRPLIAPLLAATALAGLSACATKVPDRVADARTPTEHFEAHAIQSDEEIRLAVHAQGLSPRQGEAVASFASGWRDAEGGMITLSAPAGGADGAAAFRMAQGVEDALIRQGVAADHIRIVSYEAKGDPAAPMRVSYRRYQAVVPACGRAWTNIAHSADNDVQPNFGCAVTANMAAQIADPADLLRPRETTPADVQRRAVMLDKYRKGQTTSSDADDKARGAVSNVIR